LAAYLEERIAFEQRPRASTVPVFRQYVGMFCDGGPTNFGLVSDSETGTFSDFQANSWF
jgi:hypothetical protein